MRRRSIIHPEPRAHVLLPPYSFTNQGVDWLLSLHPSDSFVYETGRWSGYRGGQLGSSWRRGSIEMVWRMEQEQFRVKDSKWRASFKWIKCPFLCNQLNIFLRGITNSKCMTLKQIILFHGHFFIELADRAGKQRSRGEHRTVYSADFIAWSSLGTYASGSWKSRAAGILENISVADNGAKLFIPPLDEAWSPNNKKTYHST